MTRGLSFSADGPVYIYKGYQDEKLLDYVPGMGAVHLNLVLRGGGNYYAVDPMPLTIISGSNDEVRFTIDYDP